MLKDNLQTYTHFLSSLQSIKTKKRNTLINSVTNYRREMKFIPIYMDYHLLQFDAFKFFLGVSLHGRPLPNFNFFNVNPQISQRNRKMRVSNCRKLIFTTILTLV